MDREEDLAWSDLTEDQMEKMLQFQDLTGIETASICRDVLQRHGWDLEVAVQEQLNMREGRPSVFASNAAAASSTRSPVVVTDFVAQQYFSAVGTGPPPGSGVTGLIRYLFSLVVNVCYHTLTSVLNFAMRFLRPGQQLMVTNPLEDVMQFVDNFNNTYSREHPVFYQGTYAQAVNDAKQELIYLLVFLHNEHYPESEEFCRSTLSDPNVINIINHNMLFWGCSVNTGEGYRVSQIMRERAYPFLAVIVVREGRMTIVARMVGRVDGPELVRRLESVIHANEIHLIAARNERLERNFNQSLRQQQDEAYQVSLRADQEKERAKEAAKQKRLQEEHEKILKLQEEQERLEEVARLKDVKREQIPVEPDANDPNSVQLIIKLPSGGRLERRFAKHHSLEDVHNYVFCHPEAPDNFEIATNFPKKVLSCTASITLETAGIKRSEVLFVYDLES